MDNSIELKMALMYTPKHKKSLIDFEQWNHKVLEFHVWWTHTLRKLIVDTYVAKESKRFKQQSWKLWCFTLNEHIKEVDKSFEQKSHKHFRNGAESFKSFTDDNTYKKPIINAKNLKHQQWNQKKTNNASKALELRVWWTHKKC